ncbi:MAG: Stp1/IreP family PP2C-type Ser/Thr phosphatase [Acidobacteriaceae bacterium]
MPESITLEAAALTDVGKVRDHNEDAYGHCLEAGVFVVCDGMGGAAAGEVASRLAVDTLIERLCAVSSPEDRRRALQESVAAANRLVFAQAAKDPALKGMGTTLVAVAVQDHSALIAHVGDSRCYLFRDGQLTRQTNDHSLVDEQVRLGHMTPEDAERSPLKNVITRAVGTQPSVEAEINELPLQPGDVLLLCCDGLIREVPDPRIEAILLTSATLQQKCQQLIDAANEAGSHDNVTVALVRAGNQ